MNGTKPPSGSPVSEPVAAEKSKSPAGEIKVPAITLPKGGGALKNIDEKFQVNAVNGTAGFSLPLPFSRTRSDFIPAMSLNYNSGTGNNVFGLGWDLGFSSIQRKTDKKLPLYQDALESDVFMFTGSEDLVPALKKDGNGNWIRDEFIALTGEKVKRYIPRIEGGFSRIDQITLPGSSTFFWKVTSRSNISTIYGRSVTARISDPADTSKIFKWLPELSYDDKGNCFEMLYVREDFKNVPDSLSEGNRLNGTAACANTYLKRIQYGNKNPYYPDPKQPYNPSPPLNPFYFFECVFDFGDHDDATPTPDIQKNWSCRMEPFSSYKAGLEIRTYRLCQRILFFHYFKELNDGISAAPYLVRSLDLTYRYFNNPSATSDEKRNAEADYIISARQTGYLKNMSGNYDKKSLPPVVFNYQELSWNKSVRTVSKENIVNAPVGLTGGYQWLDLWNEGISGILTEQAEGWYYKSNLGDGSFSVAEPVIPKPSFTGLSDRTLQLQDLNADGRKFIVGSQGPVKGYFEISDDDEWQPFQSFTRYPDIDFNDPDSRFIDLDGDGKPDIIISHENVFTWYASKGTIGFDAAEMTPKPYDEAKGPAIVFREPLQTIFLADMTGDGLTDIVRIRNGEVCYWPNLGYGRFGVKITMDNTPVFDNQDLFNPSYIHLADVSGTGTTDILYLGKNQFKAWLNLSGNKWSDLVTINPFPATENTSQISVVDLLGNGTACIVWSSPLDKYAQNPMQYIDLMGGKKPYIMNGYKNNTGKEVTWEFKSSTWYYLEDKKSARPWVTRLPFPVQCVSKTMVADKVTNAWFSTSYIYHHGYYDHPEREFRGFGMVEQTDTETFDNFIKNNSSNIVDEPLFQPPVLTKTWFHTGAFIRENKILNQFAHEYFQNPDFTGYLLPAPVLPEGMSTQEMREALRACKSMVLRQEVYALDNSQIATVPYSVAEHNCNIQLLQPLQNNRYAVFLVTESEAINYNYERNTKDPRIAHSLNIKIDELGNILQSAAVVYPRQTQVNGLPAEVINEQKKTHIIYSVTQFTNDVINDITYRLRMLSNTQAYELTGISPGSNYFSITELENGFTISAIINYEENPNGSLQKRLIEHQRTLFRKDNAIDPLPMGHMESLGLSYESYRKSYTSTLLTHLFGSRVSAPDLTAHLTEGRYIRSNDYKAVSLFPKSDADDEWWIPSGKMSFPVNPELHFFLPDKYIDPFGSITTVNYYSDYHLLIDKTTDSIGNSISVEMFDWRIPAAQLIKDLNDNYVEGRYDILGFLAGTAIKGKGNEADDFVNFKTDLTEPEITAFFKDPVANGANLLQHATNRFIYDFSVTPVRVAGIARETHHQQTLLNNTPSKLQLSFEYSDGLGHVAMKKMQAEPGIAKKLDSGNNVIEVDTSPDLRWVGNGRTVLNNKGKPIKQYEPYFSVTHEYEDDKKLVEIGVTPVLYYDPVGRLIKTDFPDGTFAKTEFDAWQQLIYDQNDTVNDSDWYAMRTTGSLSSNQQENQAAQKASVHYNTPGRIHLDSLGRSFYTIAHNRFEDHKTSLIVDEFYSTQSVLDIEGNQRQVIDARKNPVMEYAYDMLGNTVYQKSMDAGERWLLTGCMGKPMYTWDSKDQQFHITYDAIHRPLQSDVKKGAQKEIIFTETIYGEGQSNNKILNLRGQPYQSYDQAGIITRVKCDFKGNLLESNRVFTVDYDKNIDWSANPAMQNEIFTSLSEYDALNRIVKLTAPCNNISTANILVPGYNEAGLTETMEVYLRGSATRTSFVKNIDRNEKGQRTHIQYGNNVATNYTYDPLTFRLIRLITTRNAGADILQDLNYSFDPVGNITHIRDDAQDTIYFKNKKVEPGNDYTYDAVYRLTEALGREHIGQQFTPDAYDEFRMNNPQPGDGNQMQTYKQQFTYDEADNMLQMQNVNSWNRQFTYNTINNQLLTAQPGNPVTSPFTYTYDPHGNGLAMPHLAQMDWNFKDELQHITITPLTANDNSQQAWYVYDAGGQRVRKIVVKHNVTEERIYLGGIELFRRTRNNTPELERETLHVMDDKQIIALVDTPLLIPNSSKETQLIRYQFSNHLETACLELDDGNQGATIPQIISYEEYYPFGSTSYSSVDKTREVPAKRYRYTGKERDEESGLYYHGARYYAPWLARWISCDPLFSGNLFVYCACNPIILFDPTGKQEKPREFYKGSVEITGQETQEQVKAMFSEHGIFYKGNATWVKNESGSGHWYLEDWQITARETGTQLNLRADNLTVPSGGSKKPAQPQTHEKTIKEKREEDWSAAKAGMWNSAVDTLDTLSLGLIPTFLGFKPLERLKMKPPVEADNELRRYELRGNYEGGGTLTDTTVLALSFVPLGEIGEAAQLAKTKLPVPTGGLGSLGGQEFISFEEQWANTFSNESVLSERGITKRGAFPKAPEHHVFPQEFRNWFKSKGINIDEYTVIINQGEHEAIHIAGWNKEWNAFKNANPLATEQQLFEYVGKLMDKYKISDLPIVTYGTIR